MNENKIVCLIIPPSPFLLDERVFMSLGILKLASVLEKANIPVEVIDLSGVKNFCDAIKDHANRNFGKRIYGITATTPQMPSAYKISLAIREVDPTAKQILGGPHITLVNAAARKEFKTNHADRATKSLKKLEETFDVLVSGDGEKAIFQALIKNAPKLIDADDLKSDLFLTNEILEELPFPARHLIDVKSYHYSIEGFPALSIIAQLGCPFSCGFCGGRESPFLRKIRTRSSESVVDEMIHLYKTYGVTGFMMYDDELNVNTSMIDLMNKIYEAQDKLGVEWRLRGFVKSQLFTNEQAKAMYRAGFRWILSGFESGSEIILKNMNKKATEDQNSRCMEIAKNNNLKVKALMSIGHPGESENTCEDTKNWLIQNEPEDFDVTIITTYPGSPYYDQAIRDSKNKDTWVYTYKPTGDKLYSKEIDYTLVEDYYKGSPQGGYKAFVHTDYLSSNQLVEIRDQIEISVRNKLKIPFNTSLASRSYEQSMGQFNNKLPEFILRESFNINYQKT